MRYLEECLGSVLSQTFQGFELVVVDDMSTDGTFEFLKERLKGYPAARLLRNPRRKGLVLNWNRCVSLARGKWVKFVFQDDVLHPRCVEQLLGLVRQGGALAVCRRRLKFEQGVSRPVQRLYQSLARKHSLHRHFPSRTFATAAEFRAVMLSHPASNCIGEPVAALVSRAAFERRGLFDARLACLADWEFFARVAVHHGLRWTNEVLSTFRVHPSSASSANRSVKGLPAELLDELVIRHDLAFGAAYAPVRREACAARPRRDLEASLELCLSRCRALARRRGSGAAEALERVVQEHPRLRFSVGKGLGETTGRQSASVARSLWMKSVRT
jgi:glycosyltransferase involved in cell wall biosynthesis